MTEHQINKISTRYGDMAVPAEDDLVATSLHLYGEWAQLEINLLSKFIPDSGVVIDVGAFIGSHTRAFSNLVGAEGLVFAYEANPVSVDYLSLNASMGVIDNVIVHPRMLSDDVSERYSLDVPKGNLGGSRLRPSCALQDSQIGSNRLDDFKFDRVDFIKIDVEGMEGKVLKGGEALISRERPIIFAEVNSIHAGNELLSWALSRKCVPYGVISKAFNPENFKNNALNIFSHAAETGFLLIPDEKNGIYESVVKEENLSTVRTCDDVALLLLHKPQYPYEVLMDSAVAESLGVRYASPLSHEQKKRITRLLSGKKKLVRRKIALKRDLRVAEAKNSELMNELSRIKSSASWRLTIPFRYARRLGRLVRKGASNVPLRIRYWLLKRTFSPDQYLECNPDVKHSGVDPLLHYLTSGKKEGRSLQARNDSFENYVVLGKAVTGVSERDVAHVPVSVILPAYKGVALTEECIDSAFSGINEHPGCRLIIINDCSPDPSMGKMLKRKKDQYGKKLQLYTNKTNHGFVKTVNFGIKVAGHDDVVLLNSDAITPKRWLIPLVSAAYAENSVATVTPLSNNTTITAFPKSNSENPIPFGEDLDSIQACFERNDYPSVVTPTGVGFCMYIKRLCIDEIGMFDEASFGRGYGEENDFCQRAKKCGWNNVVTPNLYVYHAGGVSFGSEKFELMERASKMMEELHPDYDAEVQGFVRSDPLRVWRLHRVVDLISCSAKKKVVHITHGLGGGVKQHVDELAKYLAADVLTILIVPVGKKGDVEVFLSDLNGSADLTVSCPAQFDDLVEVLRACGVDGVHFHHFMNVPEELLSLDLKLGVRSIITIHDYYVLSSNPPLTDAEGVFPGEFSDVLGLSRCGGQCVTLQEVSAWRRRFQQMMDRAAYVLYPSRFTKDLYDMRLNLQNALVVPHPEERREPAPYISPVAITNEITVGVIGALSKEKGADLVEEVSKYFSVHHPGVHVKLIGYGYRPLEGILVTGKYNADNLLELIKSERIDALFYPSRCPETYSYVLSYGLASGLPIFAPNIGAFPERLKGRPKTMLFDHLASSADIGEQIVGFLKSCKGEVEYWEDAVAPRSWESFYSDAYLCTFSGRNGLKEVPAPLRTESIARLLRHRPVCKKNTRRMPWLFSAIKTVYWNRKMKFARKLVPVRFAKRISRAVFGSHA